MRIINVSAKKFSIAVNKTETLPVVSSSVYGFLWAGIIFYPYVIQRQITWMKCSANVIFAICMR